MIVDPGTGGVLSRILETKTTVRNQSQKQETKQDTESDKQETENKSDQGGAMKERNNREINPVEYSKNGKFHKSPTTSVSIQDTSQNIIFFSHKVTDIYVLNTRTPSLI